MATHAERKRALEALSLDDLTTFKWAGELGRASAAPKRIASILRDAEKHAHGDDLDRLLGLPTDAEQQLELQRDMVDAAKSSSRASWVSARTALISAVCAVLAVVISVVALWVARQAGE